MNRSNTIGRCLFLSIVFRSESIRRKHSSALNEGCTERYQNIIIVIWYTEYTTSKYNAVWTLAGYQLHIGKNTVKCFCSSCSPLAVAQNYQLAGQPANSFISSRSIPVTVPNSVTICQMVQPWEHSHTHRPDRFRCFFNLEWEVTSLNRVLIVLS